MSDQALVMQAVTRRFGRTTALDSLDLRVAPGSVLGLVGRNGAGKTTALRLAHGLLYPDSGSIRVLGLDPVADGLEVRTRVALLSEESALYPWMTVAEILRFASALHPRWDRQLAERLREDLDLDPGARIKALSRGTKAKLALVLAAGTRPELLLLDDPTAGLDPLVRREVLGGILGGLSDDGGAVVYASHLIHDIERVADHVVFLDDGRATLDGPMDELKSRIRRVRAVFDDGVPPGLRIPGVIDGSVDGRMLSVVADSPNGDCAAALRRLGATRVEVESLNLEEILVACLRRGTVGEVDRV
jgi:ABC-2 type transport system ATP-binding protein